MENNTDKDKRCVARTRLDYIKYGQNIALADVLYIKMLTIKYLLNV